MTLHPSGPKVVAIIQARLGSTRLPGKVLMRIGEHPALDFVVKRLKSSELCNQVAIATTTLIEDEAIVSRGQDLGVEVIRGQTDDVLGRYVHAARLLDADHIVRITADCPLVDPMLVDEAIRSHLETGAEVTLNYCPPSYPDGLDVAVATRAALEYLDALCLSAFDREHVMTAAERHLDSGKMNLLFCDEDLVDLRWTLDDQEDLEFLNALYRASCGQLMNMHYQSIVTLCRNTDGLESRDGVLLRNYGHRHRT